MAIPPFPEGEVTWYPLSNKVIRFRESAPKALNTDHPDEVCGVDIWVEFPDRETARKFREDVYRFIAFWDTE